MSGDVAPLPLPSRPLLVFVGGCVLWSLAVGVGAAALDITTHSGQWAWVAPVLMAGPAALALGFGVRLRGFAKWGRGGVWIALGPLLLALFIYGLAAGLALSIGEVELRLDAPPRLPAQGDPGSLTSLLLLALAGLLGLFGAAAEELGWRGYLQPALQPLGEGRAAALTGTAWWAFHLPLVWLTGLVGGPHPWLLLALMWALCVLESWVWYRACQLAGSLWPAVFFHAAHNLAAGHAAPALVGPDPLWLGEQGVLPTLAHLLIYLPLGLWLGHRLRNRPAESEGPPPGGRQRAGL